MRQADGLGKGQRHTGATFGSPGNQELGLGVAGEVNLHALGQEAFTTALTAAGQDGAAALGFHAGAEPELLFARPFGRLVGAFHKPLKFVWKKSGNSSGFARVVNRKKWGEEGVER